LLDAPGLGCQGDHREPWRLTVREHRLDPGGCEGLIRRSGPTVVEPRDHSAMTSTGSPGIAAPPSCSTIASARPEGARLLPASRPTPAAPSRPARRRQGLAW